jgi:hypothetical protein
MSKPAVDLIIEAAKSFEANYPETLKSSFNLNCPKVFSVLFNIIKPFLTERTLAKIQIHDANVSKWKPALLKTCPASHLPQKYAGLNSNNMATLSTLNLARDDDPFIGN